MSGQTMKTTTKVKPIGISTGEAAEAVKASVSYQRRATGATGVPESPSVSVVQPFEADEVDNPLMTDAEYREQWRRSEAKGRDMRKVGKEPVLRNMQTYLGAFGKFRGTEAQIKAAAKFKALHDQSQLGGGRACDPSVEPVDGGGVNPEAIFEIGADARSVWIDTTIWLGRQDFDRFFSVVISELGPKSYTARRTGEIVPDGRAINAHTAEIRDIAQRLVERWGYEGKPPMNGRTKHWRDETAKAVV